MRKSEQMFQCYALGEGQCNRASRRCLHYPGLPSKRCCPDELVMLHKDNYKYHEISAGAALRSRASHGALIFCKTLGHKVKWPRPPIIITWWGFFLLNPCFFKWEVIIDLKTVLVKTDCSYAIFLVPLEIKIFYPFQLCLGPTIGFLEQM